MIRLIIFARYPVPGEAKTRLIPALGPAGAAQLQHAMTLHTLRHARALREQNESVQLELRYTGATQAQLAGLYGHDIGYADQGQGDLGTRLLRAAQEAADAGQWPILVGSDCPAMDVGTLQAACQALEHNDLVLGPAVDGGYYLIGMGRPRPEPALFAGIRWSTSTVLQQTLGAARKLGLRYQLLRELPDVDEASDLPGVPSLLSPASPYRPQRMAITGATGSLGLQFLRTALEQHPKLRVVALVRSGSAWPKEFGWLLEAHGERIELVEGSLCQLSPAARRAFREASDGIWHFAASTHLQCRGEQSRRQIWQTNVEGTQSLLDQCSGKTPLLHISSAYVCGRRTGIICEADLDASWGFRNAYEESKFAAEQIVRTALDSGLPGAVFRPSVVVSDRHGGRGLKVVDQLTDALAIAIRRHAPGITLGVEAGWGINAVDGQWVIDRMLELASDPAERTYHLTAPAPITLGRLRDTVNHLYPWFHMELSPAAADPQGRSGAADRALSGYRDYLTAACDVSFDRINTQLYAPGAEEPAIDVARCLHGRVGVTPRAGIPVPS